MIKFRCNHTNLIQLWKTVMIRINLWSLIQKGTILYNWQQNYNNRVNWLICKIEREVLCILYSNFLISQSWLLVSPSPSFVENRFNCSCTDAALFCNRYWLDANMRLHYGIGIKLISMENLLHPHGKFVFGDQARTLQPCKMKNIHGFTTSLYQSIAERNCISSKTKLRIMKR